MRLFKKIILIFMVIGLLASCNSLINLNVNFHRLNDQGENMGDIHYDELQDYSGYLYISYINTLAPYWDGVKYKGWYKNGQEDGFGQFTFYEKNKKAIEYLITTDANNKKLLTSQPWKNGVLVVQGIFKDGKFLYDCYGTCYKKNYLGRRKRER